VPEPTVHKEREMNRIPILRQRRKQLTGTLSGGEQQMLAISRGLMCDPKFLLPDEPSMGLAPRIVQEIARTIRSLRDEGRTILLVEQQLSRCRLPAAPMCWRAAG
jgi:branched-chain amino acid transport system ATP-binding protein